MLKTPEQFPITFNHLGHCAPSLREHLRTHRKDRKVAWEQVEVWLADIPSRSACCAASTHNPLITSRC